MSTTINLYTEKDLLKTYVDAIMGDIGKRGKSHFDKFVSTLSPVTANGSMEWIRVNSEKDLPEGDNLYRITNNPFTNKLNEQNYSKECFMDYYPYVFNGEYQVFYLSKSIHIVNDGWLPYPENKPENEKECWFYLEKLNKLYFGMFKEEDYRKRKNVFVTVCGAHFLSYVTHFIPIDLPSPPIKPTK